MKTIYTVTIKTEPMVRFRADFGQATDPIEWQEMSSSYWSPTPYRVADAFHTPDVVARMLLGFLEMRPAENDDDTDDDIRVWREGQQERYCYHGELISEDCPYCTEETGQQGERLVYAH